MSMATEEYNPLLHKFEICHSVPRPFMIGIPMAMSILGECMKTEAADENGRTQKKKKKENTLLERDKWQREQKISFWNQEAMHQASAWKICHDRTVRAVLQLKQWDTGGWFSDHQNFKIWKLNFNEIGVNAKRSTISSS